MLRLLGLLIFLALLAGVGAGGYWYINTPQPINMNDRVNYARDMAIYDYYLLRQPKSSDTLAYFLPLAQKGNVAAETRVAELYFFVGQNDPQAYKLAASYLVKAANQGIPNAQNALGVAYRNGLGVAQVDKIEAWKWFNLSAKQGVVLAKKNLADLTPELDQAELDQAQIHVDEWLASHK
jgi:enhanced entry protein LpnE